MSTSNNKPHKKMKTKTRQKKFVKEYIKSGGIAKHAMKATVPSYTDKTASVMSVEMMKRPAVQELIRIALEETGIDYKYVLEARKKFVAKGLDQLEHKPRKNDVLVTPKDTSQHLTGIENTLSKLGKDQVSQLNNQYHQHLHLEDKTAKELLERRGELNNYFNDILQDS